MTAYAVGDARGQAKTAIARSLPNLAPMPSGDYSIIVADPPWAYALRETDATHRGRTPYPPMKDEDILALPIRALAAPSSYLFLWTTNNHMPLAFECLKAWEFEYKSIHHWIKGTKDGSKLRMGLGHYGRNCSESVLIATRGNPGSFTKHGVTGLPNVFQAPIGEHSAKPELFWQRIEPLVQKLKGSRIELFARSARDGWDAWGLESPN